MQIQTSKFKTTAIKHACSSSQFAASVSESYLSMSKLCSLVSLSYRCFLSWHEKMKKTTFTFLICLCFFTERSLADPRTTLAGTICSNKSTTTSPARENFRANFLQAMESLTPLVDRQGYAAVVNGTSMTVYGYGECMKDLDQNDCNLCFAQSRTEIMKCLPFQLANRGGRVFYDGCYIRYDDYNFFNESLGALDRTVCATNDYDGRNATVFSENAMMLVKNLSEQALNNDGFSVGYVDRGNVTVHGLVQCWEMVKGSACESCLNDAVSKVSNCTPKEEGRVLNAGCYLRYSPQRFYNNSDPDSAVGGGNNHLAAILGVIFSTLALAMIVSAVAIVYRRRNREKQRVRKELGALLRTVNKSKLNFSYESLEQATNYFNHSNKLGQGGSGSVYKGKLSDGRIVAVKRLHFITKQWIDHFFNEVNLISGIEHKNLVKLLGCSVTGPESLLVYEYLPNQSLDDYLFVKKNPVPWRARYNIIHGTAEGLAYLHEELHVRIIHRDIKLGNVLLAEDLTAKIADFGLARLFPEDKTHLSTAIAGTLGYMAPEYIVRGKLTEKVDVYSFGVLLIEVVSGKRNSTFFQESRSIIQKTWNLYVNRRLLEAVDPILNNQFPEEEAIHLLQIGLLCVQASPELRPSMSTIVKMLTDNREIPQPNQPPFLKYSSGESSQSTQSSASANIDTQSATYSNTEINRMHQLE